MLKRNMSAQQIQRQITREDICSALSQKEKIINLLQKQLKSYATIRSDYQKLGRKKGKLTKLCDNLSSEIKDKKQRQDQKILGNAQNMTDLQFSINSLTTELQGLKSYFEGLVSEQDLLFAKNEEREQQAQEKLENIEQLKSQSAKLKLQEKRLKNNAVQLQNQLKILRNSHEKTQTSIQKLHNQIFTTEQFLRNLHLEQTKLNQQINQIQKQNSQSNDIITDINKCKQTLENKQREIREEIQQSKMNIKTMKIKLGRYSTEYNEKNKFYKIELEKEKNMKNMIGRKEKQILKLNQIMKDIGNDNQKYLAENLEIYEINGQINEDYKLCARHLKNVEESNEAMKRDIANYRETNMNVIKKLKKVMEIRTNECLKDKTNIKQHYGQKQSIQFLETNDIFQKSTYKAIN